MIGFRIGRALLCGAIGGAFMAGAATVGGAIAAACLARRAMHARCTPRPAPERDATPGA